MTREIHVSIEEGREGRIDRELKVGGRMLYAADVPVPDVLQQPASAAPCRNGLGRKGPAGSL